MLVLYVEGSLRDAPPNKKKAVREAVDGAPVWGKQGLSAAYCRRGKSRRGH
jgi:hypothetical protein